MNTDPEQIRAQVDAVLADLPLVAPEAFEKADVADIDAVGISLGGLVDGTFARLIPSTRVSTSPGPTRGTGTSSKR